MHMTPMRQGPPTCLTSPAAPTPISVRSWLPYLVPVRSWHPTRGPRQNQVPVQLNEHHALDLPCKHVAAQVTDEVGEP